MERDRIDTAKAGIATIGVIRALERPCRCHCRCRFCGGLYTLFVLVLLPFGERFYRGYHVSITVEVLFPEPCPTVEKIVFAFFFYLSGNMLVIVILASYRVFGIIGDNVLQFNRSIALRHPRLRM